MWPKMLIELLPHLSRLVPMWDKFLSSKAANEKAAEDAMKALTDEVRNDLGQVTAAHAALYRQLQDQSAQIALLAGRGGPHPRCRRTRRVRRPDARSTLARKPRWAKSASLPP